MSLGIDLHADRKGSYFDPSAFLAVRVIEGLDLGAGGWMSRIDDEWRWGAGGSLTLSLGSVSVTGGAGTGGGGTSWHYGARLSAPGEASAFAGRHRFVKMALPRSLGEQKRDPLFGEAPDTLLELRVRLHRLAHDGEVDGLLLILDSTLLGWAQSQEIARDITEMRQNGKSVVAYIVSGGNRDYYLASHADQIVVNPATIVSLTGISGSLTFFKDMLAAIGIEPQFVRIGRYKSYPEQFDRTGPSDASLEQTNAMLDDFYEQLVGDIARNRNVEKNRAREWIDQGPLTANRAKELGAIELIADLTDFRAVLDELGYRSPVLVDGYPFRPVRSDEWGPHPRVAVVSVVGTIVDGPSAAIPLVNLQLAGSATLVPTFDALAKDRSVDGVLVRIDSPGGAALASELINRALRRLAKAKPVVVSIGGTAASGGYYIAAASDFILAMRGSVTGSIGIWFGKFVISGLLDKLHVRRVPTDRGQHASIFSLDRRLTDEELEQLRIRLAEGYELFVSRILETRKFSRDELEEVAQGRVWSGGRAIANRLVDAEGGSLEALLELKGRMGLSSERAVDLVFLPASSLSVRISQALGGGMGEGSTDSESIDVAALLDLLGTPRAWAFDPHIPALTGF
ncbi:MAG: S49 family peptidase [Deltaproteobacteria bacterium]|nr:S49 family peptidase [Deltaproteobacteria bacterium]